MNFPKKRCVAMLLAGGQGSRLLVLTENTAKPAVPFGGKYRIIDFPLSNCVNSGIDTVGILTQYQPLELNEYIGNGQPWGLNRSHGGVSVLPPYAKSKKSEWYKGTANAIYQNIPFIERYDPENVLILSGDHIYRMDYARMLRYHEEHDSDVTIAVRKVPMEEASRFGIMNCDDEGRILEFVEKPKEPKSNLASMGIYIFTADLLIKTLEEDAVDPNSSHDFGGDIIPKLLADGKRLFTYKFEGFWRDVGTISSYLETSMDLLGSEPAFDIFTNEFPIMSNSSTRPPAFYGPNAEVEDCLVDNGAQIFGKVTRSILAHDVFVGEGAVVEQAVLLPGARIEAGAKVVNAILGDKVVVEAGATLGSLDADTATVGNGDVVRKGE